MNDEYQSLIESLVNINNKIKNVDETVHGMVINLDDAFKNDLYMKDKSIEVTDFKEFNSELHNSVDQFRMSDNFLESTFFKDPDFKRIIPQHNDLTYSLKPKIIHSNKGSVTSERNQANLSVNDVTSVNNEID